MEYQIKKFGNYFKVTVSINPLTSAGLYLPNIIKTIISNNLGKDLLNQNYDWYVDSWGNILAEFKIDKRPNEKIINSHQRALQKEITKLLDDYVKFINFLKIHKIEEEKNL